jgi:CII-binding regulator of phage lambda lysogenization HflD
MNEAAKKKLEQLQQAVSVLDKVIDQCSWASDMTDYQDISEQMDSVLDAADSAKDQIESLITDLEYQMEEFQEKHDEFLMENEVKV